MLRWTAKFPCLTLFLCLQSSITNGQYTDPCAPEDGAEDEPCSNYTSMEISSLLWQKTDHFDDLSDETWRQGYYVGFQFRRRVNPPLAFLFVNGHNSDFNLQGHKNAYSYLQWADRFGAAIFQLDRRFYEAYPYSPRRLTTVEALHLLTIDQSLEDIKTFILKMNEIHFGGRKDVRWLLIGKSFGGTLAAWFRAKYPELTIGAIVSSAPMEPRANYFEYINNVGRIYAESLDCYYKIRHLFNELHRFVTSGAPSRNVLRRYLRLSTPFDEHNLSISIQFFFYQMASFVDSFALFRKSHLNRTSFCSFIENDRPRHVIERLKAAIDHYGNFTRGYPNNYWDFIYNLVDPYKTPNIDRSWLWERCNGMGLFTTTDAETMYKGLYGSVIPINFFINQCSSAFGVDYDLKNLLEKEKELRQKYGTRESYNGTNVVFTYGSFDAYRDIAFDIQYANEDKQVYSIEIEGGYHLDDMNEIADVYDSDALREARNRTEEIIAKWIQSTKKNTVSYASFINIAFTALIVTVL